MKLHHMNIPFLLVKQVACQKKNAIITNYYNSDSFIHYHMVTLFTPACYHLVIYWKQINKERQSVQQDLILQRPGYVRVYLMDKKRCECKMLLLLYMGSCTYYHCKKNALRDTMHVIFAGGVDRHQP
jgi:hypothetical protein